MTFLRRGPLGLKPDRTGNKDPEYLARVAELPCIVCEAYGEPQRTRTTVHHVIHGRGGNRKTPDRMAIPLCADHHLLGGNGKLALHSEPTKWKRLYGEDHTYTAILQDRLGL
jgi:hypothetical protein